MIKDSFSESKWVILGHSERRSLPELKESDDTVAIKTAYALSKGTRSAARTIRRRVLWERVQGRRAGPHLPTCSYSASMAGLTRSEGLRSVSEMTMAASRGGAQGLGWEVALGWSFLGGGGMLGTAMCGTVRGPCDGS